MSGSKPHTTYLLQGGRSLASPSDFLLLRFFDPRHRSCPRPPEMTSPSPTTCVENAGTCDSVGAQPPGKPAPLYIVHGISGRPFCNGSALRPWQFVPHDWGRRRNRQDRKGARGAHRDRSAGLLVPPPRIPVNAAAGGLLPATQEISKQTGRGSQQFRSCFYLGQVSEISCSSTAPN